MSIKLMSAIWEYGPEKQSERFVLLALADYASDVGECWPAVKSIAEKVCMTERGVQKIIQRLEAENWLSVNYGGGRHGCNFYTINPERCSPRNAVRPPNVDTETPNVDAENPERGSPEPSLTINEPSVVPPVSPKQKSRRAVAIPGNWVPSQKNIDDARDKNLTDQEIADEADSFRDHHLAKGTTFKDWDAGWRTWVRNSIKYRGRGMARQAYPGRHGQGSGIAGVVARRQFGG